VLNVRAEPNAKSKKVYSFGPTVTTVRSTGRLQTEGGTKWLEVSFEGGTGWVNRAFLLELRPGGGCNDSNLTAVIRQFMRAVANTDSATLQEIVSPVRGLLVRQRTDGPVVRFGPDEAGGVFTSSASKDWGGGDFNTGPFKKVILPSLRDDVAGKGAQEKCVGADRHELGWPDDFAGFTLVSFTQPHPASGPPHTTVAGLEYVDGKPYVAALVQP
jgi:hypothetical protein